ncbi:MAG: hypothetical protein NC311_14330, partial [Muribaculaceae bacterium]|nr:hypothetical protein [Muribaculaceae bacterium]
MKQYRYLCPKNRVEILQRTLSQNDRPCLGVNFGVSRSHSLFLHLRLLRNAIFGRFWTKEKSLKCLNFSDFLNLVILPRGPT